MGEKREMIMVLVGWLRGEDGEGLRKGRRWWWHSEFKGEMKVGGGARWGGGV